jgi:hypothetical protein
MAALQILDAAGLLQSLATFLDPSGVNMSRVQSEAGQYSHLDITAATLVKAAPGRAYKVSVIVAGSAVGTLNDCATTGAAATANQVGVIPNTVGVYSFDWPHAVGIVLVPGSGQTLAISYT